MKRTSDAPSIRLLFCLHSVTCLAYEIIWIKILESRLGMSTAALGTVLAVFISGLGIGSWIVAKQARLNRRSTRWRVAGAELALAVWSALLPFTLRLFDSLYTHWAPPYETLFHHALRTAIAVALVLPSTILMGTIFPLLAEHVESETVETPGKSLSRLYQDGLLASALGCIFLPAILIRLCGLMGANQILALLSAATAAWALWSISKIHRPRETDFFSPSSEDAESIMTLCVVSFLLGACLLMIEVCGGHFVWLLVNDTFYSNGILIGVILMMMGLGAWLFPWVRKRLSLTGTIVGGFVLFVISVLLWMQMPYLIAQAYHAIAGWPALRIPGGHFFLSTFALVFLILAGPSVASGFVFPGLCEWAMTERFNKASVIGRLTAYNYLGSMTGSLAATFVLIPHFGMTKTVAWAALLAGAALVIVALPGTKDPLRRYGILISGGLFSCLCLWLGKTTDITFPDQQAGSTQQVIFHHEDAASIVEIFEDLETGDRFLYSNRLRMEGSNAPGENVHKVFQGALPILLHPAPRQVLVVGLGTGASLANNLRSDVEHLTCVEYARGISEAAPFFERENQKILLNPRVTLVHQDGRNFIKLSRQRYDVIIQDLFFPYQTGVGNLYTREHFQEVRAHLNPHGRFAQWVPLHQIGIHELKSLVKTFQNVFPSTSLWLDGRFLLLYGGDEPLSVPWTDFKNRMEGTGALPETNPYDFINFFVADEHSLTPWVASSTINTDDNLLIETQTPLLFEHLDAPETGFKNTSLVMQLFQPTLPLLEKMTTSEMQNIQRARRARTLYFEGVSRLYSGNFREAFQIFNAAYQLNPADYEVRDTLSNLLFEKTKNEFMNKQWPAAEGLLQQALSYNPSNRNALYLLAEIYYEEGRRDASVFLFEKTISLYPNYFQARMALGDRLFHLQRYQEAADQFLYVSDHQPHSVESRFDLANCLLKLGKVPGAVYLYKEVLRLDKNHVGAREILRLIQPATKV